MGADFIQDVFEPIFAADFRGKVIKLAAEEAELLPHDFAHESIDGSNSSFDFTAARVIGVATLILEGGQNLNFAISVEQLSMDLRTLEQQPLQKLQPTIPFESPGQERTTPNLSEFVRRFLESGNYDDPGTEASFYADDVNYFDNGNVSKDFVVKDIQKYNQRWPRRHYSVYGEPRVEIVDYVHKVARAIVTFQFVAQNSQKIVQGSCQDVIYIRDATTNPNVISVKSKMLSRNVALSGP